MISFQPTNKKRINKNNYRNKTNNNKKMNYKNEWLNKMIVEVFKIYLHIFINH